MQADARFFFFIYIYIFAPFCFSVLLVCLIVLFSLHICYSLLIPTCCSFVIASLDMLSAWFLLSLPDHCHCLFLSSCSLFCQAIWILFFPAIDYSGSTSSNSCLCFILTQWVYKDWLFFTYYLLSALSRSAGRTFAVPGKFNTLSSVIVKFSESEFPPSIMLHLHGNLSWCTKHAVIR